LLLNCVPASVFFKNLMYAPRQDLHSACLLKIRGTWIMMGDICLMKNPKNKLHLTIIFKKKKDCSQKYFLNIFKNPIYNFAQLLLVTFKLLYTRIFSFWNLFRTHVSGQIWTLLLYLLNWKLIKRAKGNGLTDIRHEGMSETNMQMVSRFFVFFFIITNWSKRLRDMLEKRDMDTIDMSNFLFIFDRTHCRSLMCDHWFMFFGLDNKF
jgi:hypothetical protein